MVTHKLFQKHNFYKMAFMKGKHIIIKKKKFLLICGMRIVGKEHNWKSHVFKKNSNICIFSGCI